MSLQTRLRSAEPDITVIVGSEGETESFSYHGALLAAHSGYIDALLVSNMKESNESTIRFPEISVDTWKDIVRFLDPIKVIDEDGKVVHDLPSVEEVLELVPFFDKYQFEVGLHVCDLAIRGLAMDSYGFGTRARHANPEARGILYQAIRMAHEYDLPLSKPKAISLATNAFHRGTLLEPETAKYIMPLLEIDDLKEVSRTISGDENLYDTDSFWPEYFDYWRGIQEVELVLDKLLIEDATATLGGEFLGLDVNDAFGSDEPRPRGARRVVLTARLDAGEVLVVRAVDAFGKSWVCGTRDEENSFVYEPTRVIYTWSNKRYNTLVPPRNNWTLVDTTWPDGPLEINYQFRSF